MFYYTYYSYEEFGRGYIGSRQCKCLPEEDVKYFGSYTDKTFKPTHKIILETYNIREEALIDEVKLHEFYDVHKNPHFANQAKLTSEKFYVNWDALSIEQRSKISKQRSERVKKYHARLTPEQRSQIIKKALTNKNPDEINEIRKKRSESIKKLISNMTPEQRSERIRKMLINMTTEKRIKAAKKRLANTTPEQRSEAVRKGWKNMTPEQRSERAKKRWENKTPEQRSEITRRGRESISVEKRSEIVRNLNYVKFQCTETGYISNAGGLSTYQKARGIDTSKRIKLS